ncbi:MAG: LamG-like jellyroll fold domain-containing protein [Pirellulales bacterium]
MSTLRPRRFFLGSLCVGVVLVLPASPGSSWPAVQAAEPVPGLLGHWPLAGDGRDVSGHGRHATAQGVDWQVVGPSGQPATAAGFDGRAARLEIPAAALPPLGTRDFSLSVWVRVADTQSDLPGDVLSQYDPARQRGWHLSLATHAGVTFNQAGWRLPQFGIDNQQTSTWEDCGRPGNGLLAFALAVHDGQLFAGVCRPGADETGRVYRYQGGTQWEDCGAPDDSNTVTALATYRGQLYAGTGKYRLAGSALPESLNPRLGGRVFRYAGGQQWIPCGRLGESEAVAGLVVYRDQLYAASLYKPAGFFRYGGDTQWQAEPVPDGRRVESLGIYNGHLYATTYDGGRVYRFDGRDWLDCGALGDEGQNTQTYAFAVYQGKLMAGTWPSGRVYQFVAPGEWRDFGRLGEELEVMGMLVHNGRLVAGTLPGAEIHTLTRPGHWQRLTQLDTTPDVKYRRAWTLAEFQGKLFCSTLPSGRIFSTQFGRTAMAGHSFPAGWQPLTAVRRGPRLELYVAGRQVAVSEPFAVDQYDLSTAEPLVVGSGPSDFFDGQLAHLRLYERALSKREIEELASAFTPAR